MQEIYELLNIMQRLRDPQSGCPWDSAQTFASIVPHTIEEAYEVADAIAQQDWQGLRKELGDVLFQVVFYAQLASEENYFNFTDIVTSLIDKMVRRHPHVFADTVYKNQAEQTADWERIKKSERETPLKSVLDGVPLALPGTTRALKLQRKAAQVGFDWATASQVLAKVSEEAQEIQMELETHNDPTRLNEEVGDLLFACVNLARHLAVDPESALRAANGKFMRRFQRIEALLRADGRSPQDVSLQELDKLWEQTKDEEKPDRVSNPLQR
jgi:MazG family protein